MIRWYSRSFDSRLSDLKKPFGSEKSITRRQNSSSLGLDGRFSTAARVPGRGDGSPARAAPATSQAMIRRFGRE